MSKKCCVVNCDTKFSDSYSLHKFPKTEIGLFKWLDCIKSDELRCLSPQQLQCRYVCAKHFEKKFYTTTASKRPRLHVEAYPTLFTETEIATGVSQSFRDIVHANESERLVSLVLKRKHDDHTYCKVDIGKRHKTEVSNVKEKDDNICHPASTAILSTQEVSNMKEKDDNICHPASTSAILNKQEVSNIKEKDDNLCHPASTPEVHKKQKVSIVKAIPNPATPRVLTRPKRIIMSQKLLTPKCHRLYQEIRKSRRQLEFSQRAKRALKFSKSKYFERLTQNLNPWAKRIIWMQINQCTKASKGRRFSDEDKLVALTILKQSPKCYRFLQKIFILPSKQTINKMISKLNIEAGLNNQIFEAIKNEVKDWTENKKLCTVIFDEIALDAAVTYDKHKDSIDGFVELDDKKKEFADHALVFMLRGAIHKWQQPVAFFFCKGATSSVYLKKIIKDLVTAVGNTGLLPIALVCDQGTSFRSAINMLLEDTRQNQIKNNAKIDGAIDINGHILHTIYDPPHLLKGLRNNFITKNIKLDGKLSKWSDIVDVYKTDCNHADMRLMHKLNDEHVIPEKNKKMKVKNCTRVFSKTVAATLSYTAQFSHYANGGQVSNTLKNTAEIVSFFDDLFDSVNGASLLPRKGKGKPLRTAITTDSKHYAFWGEAIKKLKKIKFVDSQGRETSVPSLKNWVTTLQSYRSLWQFLQKKNIKVMRPRYFNSDPIENLFGQVRAYNFRNNDPNCHTFKSTFKSLLISRFIKFHSENFNCEDDSSKQLLNLDSLFKAKDNREAGDDKQVQGCTSAVIDTELNTPAQQRLSVHSQAYTAGWVTRKIAKKIDCDKCKSTIMSKEKHIDHKSLQNWIYFKEFECAKKFKLAYPSEGAVRFFSQIKEEALKNLESQPHIPNIMAQIKDVVKNKHNYDFLDCIQHRENISNQFINLTLNLIIFNWCNTINKILKGTDIERLKNKRLPYIQQKAYAKYCSKLKKKKLGK